MAAVRRKRRVLTLFVAGVLVFATGTLVGAQFMKSPAQAAADAGPPPAGPITFAVQKRVLRNTIVLRGTVAPAQSIDVRSPGSHDGSALVVTRLPVKVNDAVKAGDVIAEVSGRPVIVLPGADPAYRDLTPSAQGADVAELQAALRAIGHTCGGDPAGTYGSGTKAAVAALYQAVGYPVVDTSKDDDQQLLAAQRRVRDAREALASAQTQPPGPSGTAQLAQALSDAQVDLATLVAHTGAIVPAGEVVFVPFLPARVASLAATVGSAPPNIMMTLGGGDLVVHGDLAPQDAGLVRVGQPVEIFSEVVGAGGTGTVANVAPPTPAPVNSGAQPSDQSAQQVPLVSPNNFDMLVTPSPPLAQQLDGQDVRLTVESARTSGPVLVVPLAAVSSRADGQAQVIRVVHGREENVLVTAGVSGGGFVAVSAVSGQLAAGDQVVIGR
jgi:peptidoglycan hydrolase-like protein with peptidoglycan-binding domain